jgi:hypothetical protein
MVRGASVAQEQGVAFPVGQIERSSEAVGKGVHHAESRVGEGQASVEGCEHHAPPVLKVVERRCRTRKMPRHEAHRLQGMQIREGRGGIGDIGFHGVVVSASMPVATVRFFSMVSVVRGSTRATSGPWSC